MKKKINKKNVYGNLNDEIILFEQIKNVIHDMLNIDYEIMK